MLSILQNQLGVALDALTKVADEEEALQARSEGFNLERKAERGELWLLVRGRGRGGRYFRGSRKF